MKEKLLTNTLSIPTPPPTQGIKYAGSKLKLLPHILSCIAELDVKTVLDGFSGTTRVSQALAQRGFRTISSDIALWSETFAKAYLLNTHHPSHFQALIDHLNSLEGYAGWFTEHYGGEIALHQKTAPKRPFQRKNAMKLDAVRDEIERLNLSDHEKAVALTSLILALDNVDSTLGHYASYLADWSPRSNNNLRLVVPKLFINTDEHEVVRGDIFDTIQNRTFDLAYFDPPYGSHNTKMPPSRIRYNSYYHLWTTVILDDKPPIFGKANRREDSRDEIAASVFEEFRSDENGQSIAMQAIKRLIAETNARYILLSYSSGGRATREELTDILTSGGKLLKAEEINYKKNVMGEMRWTNEWITSDGKYCEYLFLLEKR
ncbi:MAG: DNA adenine methylase [Candidatus Kapabacteria bacterium]|jgi:adenine-specific DNA-methyltransferase|nr:DNA adenine methylase [Candidatus Kapabacteria bacterium]